MTYVYREEASEMGSMEAGGQEAPAAETTSENLDAKNVDDAPVGEEDTASDKEMSFEEWQKKEAEAAGKPEEEEAKPEEEDQKKEEEKEAPKKKEEELRDVEYSVDGKTFTAKGSDIPHMLAKVAGADQRYNDAANVRKEALEFVNFIKENPIEAMAKAGLDFEELAIEHVYNKYEYDNMTEEQQKHHDGAKENAKLKEENDRLNKRDTDEKAEADRVREQEIHDKETEAAQENLGQEIQEALEASTSGIPRNKFTVSRMALYMKDGLSKGYDLSAADVLQYVERDYKEMMEDARKSEVKEFKENQVNEIATGDGTVKSNKKPQKRISSIYDLLD